MKLPILPFLHLTSLGAVGGMVLSGLQLKDDMETFEVHRVGIRPALKAIPRVRPKPRPRPDLEVQFWTTFSRANFTGRVEDQEKLGTGVTTVSPGTPTKVVQLDEVLQVIAISHGLGLNGAVVEYIATVEVPERYRTDPGRPKILGSMPRNRRASQALANMQRQRVASPPPHHLKIGDSLWPPYDKFYLHSIAKDASLVEFKLRSVEPGDASADSTQQLCAGMLSLSDDVHFELDKARGKQTLNLAADVEKPGDAEASSRHKWVDRPHTFLDPRGNVNISRKDSRWMNEHGGQIFNEDVHMRDYSSGRGKTKVRGIQLRKLSSRVQQFGAHEGDVITSINNTPIKGMAQARRITRRLYGQGVRTFRLGVLRRGARIALYYYLDKK